MKTSLKIFNPAWSIDVDQDWGLVAEFADFDEVMKQPYRIACVPALFSRPDNFAYKPELANVDLSRFDLVLVTDIEQERYSHIEQWIQERGIKNYVIAVGSIYNSDGINPANTVLRSWWMQNLLDINTYRDTHSTEKPFWFDALLGARRPHRDFVMLSLQKHPHLLEKCIANYRDIFYTGQIIDGQNQLVHDSFPYLKLNWPYVSPNMNPDWEVSQTIDKSISSEVPWKIYEQTWYSAVCETSFTGDGFFLTEKTSKALFAQRVFVLFGPCQFLKNLRDLGFQTFGDVIDESYDNELVDNVRFKHAFSQMLSLTYQAPVEVYKKLKPVLEHNHRRMHELRLETAQQMNKLLAEHIPHQYLN